MKKQKISDKLQNKFNKPQFRIGDAVLFSWLGQKQCGYVIKTKQTNWGIQYTVESASRVKYPCGIQIQGQKTHYNTGFIFFEDTVSTGTDELKRRFQTEVKRGVATIIRNPGGSNTKSQYDSGVSGTNVADNHNKNTTTKKRRSLKSNAVSSGTGRNNADNTKKRRNSKNTELDTAIEKQRNFLNGFVKRD